MTTVWLLTNGDENPRVFRARRPACIAAQKAAALRCKRASERIGIQCTIDSNEDVGDFDHLWWSVRMIGGFVDGVPTVMVWKLQVEGSAIDALAELSE